MAVSWVGLVGGKTGGTGNASPIAIEWDETIGRTMIMVASMGRPLGSTQTQGTVTWGVPTGWNFVTSLTKVDAYDTGTGSDGSFVSQAIYFRTGTDNLFNRTDTITHDGLAGGFARVDIYAIDNASSSGLVFHQSGYAANPTGALVVGFRDALYLAAYADSAGGTPTWTPSNGFTELNRFNYTSLGWAQSYLTSASGWKTFPRITGANINAGAQLYPWVYHQIVFGTRSLQGWYRGHPWG